jgi:hypothetical protein
LSAKIEILSPNNNDVSGSFVNNVAVKYSNYYGETGDNLPYGSLTDAEYYKGGLGLKKVLVDVIEDFEDTTYNFTLTGNWALTTSKFYEGTQCLANTNHAGSSDGSAYLDFTTEFDGSTLTFYYSVSSEANFDKFWAYLDDVVKVNGVSGTIGWTLVTLSGIPAGNHRLRLRYTKDSGGNSGSDTAWVDMINLNTYAAYVASGSRKSEPVELRDVAKGTEYVKWVSNEPAGTSLTVKCAVTDTTPVCIESGTGTTNLVLNKEVFCTTALSSGSLVTNGSTVTDPYASCAAGLQAVTVDLGDVISINKLIVWHYYSDARIYNGTKTEVSADGITWETIYNSAVSGTYTETSAGKTMTFTYKKVRFIRDWLNGSNKNTGNHWVEIQAFKALLSYTYPDDISYVQVSNGEQAPGITLGDSLTGKYLWVKEELASTNASVTPKLNSLTVETPNEDVVSIDLAAFVIDESNTSMSASAIAAYALKSGETGNYSINLPVNQYWTIVAKSYAISDRRYLTVRRGDIIRELYNHCNVSKCETTMLNRSSYQYYNASLRDIVPASMVSYSYNEVIPETIVDDSYTKMLLHMDRPNYNTVFTDEAGHNIISAYGSVSTKGITKNFGINCASFNGSSNYLRLSPTDFSYGTNDFTMETWIYMNSMPTSDAWPSSWSGHMSIMGIGTAGASNGCNLVLGATKLILQSNDGQIINGTHGIILNSWTHVAVSRSGTTFRLFVNGITVATATSASSMGSGAYFYIGCETGEGARFNGNMSELRVSTVARWTSNFELPQTPYVADGSTKLLMHMEESPFVDDCGKPVTNTNTVSCITQPVGMKAKFGNYCGVFNGGTDYLKLDPSADWNLITGDGSLNVTWGVRTGSHPATQAAMDALFTTYVVSPQSTTHSGVINWGRTSAPAKPSYLPADMYVWKGSGYIYCPADGVYTFSIDEDDCGDLLIDDTLVVSEYNASGSGVTNTWAITGAVTLTRGWHSFTARVEDGTGGDGFGVAWKRPGDASFAVIPAKHFSTYIPSESQDFTVDLWVHPTAFATNKYMVCNMTDANNYWGVYTNVDKTVGFYAIEGGVVTANYLSAANALTINTWNHIAVVRNGTDTNCIKLYANGADVTPVTPTVNLAGNMMPKLTGSMYIGQAGNSSSYYAGYMDEVRLSKGVARWTSSFIPYVKAYGGLLKKRFVFAQFID